jgi:hypothetical protein
MRERTDRKLGVRGAHTAGVLVSALLWSQCSPTQPAPASPPSTASAAAIQAADLLSVRELMELVIDPVADYIFDAAVFDASTTGTVATQPVSDDDWLKVERGAWQIAESSHLLKMPRRVAPVGTERVNVPGKPAPELSTAEIQAKIDGDRALWNTHADGMRLAALEAVKIVKARDAEGLFRAGDIVNKACEACHLEYWYPGDKTIVEADMKKRVTFDPPKPK